MGEQMIPRPSGRLTCTRGAKSSWRAAFSRNAIMLPNLRDLSMCNTRNGRRERSNALIAIQQHRTIFLAIEWACKDWSLRSATISPKMWMLSASRCWKEASCVLTSQSLRSRCRPAFQLD